jgi:hypothetical protein
MAVAHQAEAHRTGPLSPVWHTDLVCHSQVEPTGGASSSASRSGKLLGGALRWLDRAKMHAAALAAYKVDHRRRG